MNTMNEESQSDNNICEFCKKIFSTKSSLLIHQRKTKKCLLLQGKNDNKNKNDNVDDVEKSEDDDVEKIDAEKDKTHRAEIEKLMAKLEDREDYIERLCGKLNRYELTIIKLYAHLCGSYENYTHSDYERYGDDIARLTQNYLRYINEHPELTKNDKKPTDNTNDTNENE